MRFPPLACRRVFGLNHSADQIYKLLERHVAGDFGIFEEFPWGKDFLVADLGYVQIVQSKLSHNFEEESTPVWMIFKIGEKLYKANGIKDSYGGCRWSTNLKEVRKKEVVSFEYV